MTAKPMPTDTPIRMLMCIGATIGSDGGACGGGGEGGGEGGGGDGGGDGGGVRGAVVTMVRMGSVTLSTRLPSGTEPP